MLSGGNTDERGRLYATVVAAPHLYPIQQRHVARLHLWDEIVHSNKNCAPYDLHIFPKTYSQTPPRRLPYLLALASESPWLYPGEDPDVNRTGHGTPMTFVALICVTF